jgi:hypothetical protein
LLNLKKNGLTLNNFSGYKRDEEDEPIKRFAAEYKRN